jgi:uncharacterized repeat protein (TIGR01451 family)
MSRLLPVLLVLLTLPLSLGAQPAVHADLVIEAAPPAQLPVNKTTILWSGLRNLGPDAAENVVITTVSGQFLRTLGCRPDGQRCTIDFLPAGSEVTIGVDVSSEVEPGRLQWGLEVTSDTPDPNRDNNRIAGEIEIVRAPVMSFSLFGNTADPGEPVEYTASIRNESAVEAEDVSFTLPLPEGWSFERSLTDELRCETIERNVRCTIGDVAPFASVQSRFLVRAPNQTAGATHASSPVTLTTTHGLSGDPQRYTAFFATSIYRHITVTSTADSGEGSLRYAIALANADCTGHPKPQCKIVFDIAGEGPYRTIRPESPLPAVSGVVLIDGSTQTRRHGDTNPFGPEIELNGSLLSAGNGLEATGNFFGLAGVVVNGFPDNGLVFGKGFSRSVTGSYIGTDVTGRAAIPNGGRGIVADLGTEYGSTLSLRDNVISGNRRAGVVIGSLFEASIIGNRIGASADPTPQPLGNGASGIYVSSSIYSVTVQKNVISFNGEAGVAITPSSTGYVAIRGNSMTSNGTLGIDYGLDLVSSAPPFPVITATRYDESSGTTRIEGRITSSATEIELFANDTPGNEGHGQGELFLGRVPLAAGTFTFDYPGDLRGRFISATATMRNSYWPELPWLFTSEFGPSFRVEGEAAAPIDRAAAVPRGADLWVNIGAPFRLEPGVPGPGQVHVQNLGPMPSSGAVVEVTSSNARLSQGYGLTGCEEIDGGLRCELGTATAVNFTIEAAPGAAKVDLTARVTSSTHDPDPLNNVATREIEVTGIPNLELRVESPGPVDPGAIATYVVRVFHRSAVDAHDLEVRIPLAAGWALVTPPERWSCSTEGNEIVCRLPRLEGLGSDAFALGIRASLAEDLIADHTTTARLTARERQHPFTTHVPWQRYALIRVTTTADEGSGSLRDAIARANGGCKFPGYHCKIIFAIDAAEARGGVFTIRPRQPLGEIVAYNIFIDARTQTAHSGDTNPLGPEVELNGSQVSGGNGFDILSHGQAVVRGFAVNGFPEHGLSLRFSVGASGPHTRRHVADNYIGTDPTGRVAVPNRGRGIVVENNPEQSSNLDITTNVISGNARAGIFIDAGYGTRISRNRIGLSAGDEPLPNGASGIFLGRTTGVMVEDNVIAHNAHAGIAVDRSASWNGFRRNATYDNGGLGVDHALDDVTHNDDSRRPEDLPAFPTILSAAWDASAGVTRITGRIEGWRFNRAAMIELFLNDTPDGSGYGEAQRSLGEVGLAATTEPQTFTFEIAEDLRGRFVTATQTRFGFDSVRQQWTSEIGQAVPVQ